MAYKFNPFTGELDYYETGSGGGAVDSVNGQTGTVVLDADDIDDTSTVNKFVTAQDLADIASNTAARHSAVTIGTNTATALSLSGQQLSIADVFVQNTGDTMTGQLVISSGGLTVDGATIFNNAGAATGDFVVKGDSDTNLLFVDYSADKIGFGTATPDEKLHVIGNFQVDDAETATKGYRFRTSGSDLDFDASGKDLYLSVYAGAGFTGTQRVYMRMGAELAFVAVANQWEWKKTGGIFNATAHKINPDGESVFNEDGDSIDVRFEGDTDTNLVFVDASTDRVGVGTNTPDEKLHVAGNLKVTGYTDSRVRPRVTTSADAATHTINSDTTDLYTITAQAQAFTMAAPSGTPTQGQKLMIRIKDDGTNRAITWTTGSAGAFRELGVTLPTTTVASKAHYIGCVYNTTDSRWDVLAVSQEV